MSNAVLTTLLVLGLPTIVFVGLIAVRNSKTALVWFSGVSAAILCVVVYLVWGAPTDRHGYMYLITFLVFVLAYAVVALLLRAVRRVLFPEMTHKRFVCSSVVLLMAANFGFVVLMRGI